MTKRSKIIAEPELGEVRAYDLASPEHRVGAVQAIIDNVCKQFERLAKQMFQHTLRCPVEFQFLQQEAIKLQEYLQPLSKQSLYREFNVSPHNIGGTLAIERDLQFFLVDLFFGGKGLSKGRTEISDTELRLVERFFSQILHQYSIAWQTVTQWQCQLQSRNSLQLSSSAQAGQLYQVCRFSMNVGGHKGWVDISLPSNGLDFLRDQQAKSEDVATDPELQRIVNATLKKAPIRLHSTLCERQLPLGDIMALKVGDVIPVELPSEVVVRAGQTPLFTAKVAENNATLVLQIQNIIEQ
ncbi:flagellar motor switch protein FliM [Enterovibrio makurazakiensis]|uniref:Flagellar motor switch protein FliM n=1 Tax=Enterovibrio gelatinilyticus TaxID=2899819 RepID=A0ABT5R0L4_9GAMM|nr:flagellar motor switch protein FliM [Enterovibrio sp. ZSDZ42]MDD1793544.1 flagellar motor switch protein FliM [Enterovibrio sp. ZSDZ42]